MAANHLKQALFVEVVMHDLLVLHVNAQKRQFEVEVLTHSAKRSTAAPDHHEVGFVLKQALDVMGQAFDGVLFTDPLDLLFGPLHESRRGGRPRLAVHANLPFTLGVDRFVQIHDLRDGRAKVAQCKRQGDLCRRFWSRSKTAGVHFHTTGYTDERRCWCIVSRRLKGVNDVPCRAVAAGVEDGIDPGFHEFANQPSRVLRRGGRRRGTQGHQRDMGRKTRVQAPTSCPFGLPM